MDAATHAPRVPFQRRHAFAGRHVPHLERVVGRRRHDAPPVRKHGNAPDLRRRHIITKVLQKADAAPHGARVPFQRRHAFAGRHVPHLDHSWRHIPITRHDASPVRKHRNAIDLRRRHIITKVQWTPQRTARECPSSVATHSPVSRSHTLTTPGRVYPSQDTTRRPSGNTATPQTYNEDTSSQRYSGRRNAPSTSALSASPRTRRSPRPTP